jgi:serine/threonine protein kinase
MVALKIPRFSFEEDSKAQRRFLREARSTGMLRHASICPVYDVGEIDGIHYLSMAYIEGRPLSELIGGSGKPLVLRGVAALVRKLAKALAEAHRHQVVHRDLKPANIMVTASGQPVIMDFGLARRGNLSKARVTKEGAILGTPAYMAPEQARGQPEHIGPACDIYSLGVILYELITGRLPFAGDAMAVLSQLLVDEPPRPSQFRPDLDPELEAICQKALAKQPQDRYRSMGQFARALTRYLKALRRRDRHAAANQPVGETPFEDALATTEPLPRASALESQRRPQGLRWGLLALAAAAALLLGVSVALLRSRPPASSPDHTPPSTVSPSRTQTPRGDK